MKKLAPVFLVFLSGALASAAEMSIQVTHPDHEVRTFVTSGDFVAIPLKKSHWKCGVMKFSGDWGSKTKNEAAENMGMLRMTIYCERPGATYAVMAACMNNMTEETKAFAVRHISLGDSDSSSKNTKPGNSIDVSCKD